MRRIPARPARSMPVARCASLALLVFLATAPAATAQVSVHPGGNFVFVSSQSNAGGVEDLATQNGPGIGTWGNTQVSNAHDNLTGADAGAFMTLASGIDSSLIGAMSTGAASVSGSPASNRGGALVSVLFYVDWTVSYTGETQFVPGDIADINVTAFLLNMSARDHQMINFIQAAGTTGFTGRLSPGAYMFFYANAYGPTSTEGTATTLGTSLAFERVAVPLISDHPGDAVVPAGEPATFTVGATGTLGAIGAPMVGAITYQWRHNFVPLADGGNISGATSPQLTIASATFADSGVYDCVVSQDDIDEPSSLARLRVTNGTADAGPAPASSGLALAAPAPSPFTTRTSLRFTLPRAADVQMDVLDVTGRRVKSLIRSEHREAGAHVAEWDGRDDDGAPVGPGVYFARVSAGGDAVSRRVVRVGR